MTALLLPNYARSPKGIVEFAPRPANLGGGVWNGTCTFAALEAILAAIENRAPSVTNMAAMAADAAARKYTSANNGAITLARIAQYAKDRLGWASRIIMQYNYTIHNGSEEIAIDWHGAMKTHAGHNGILVQVAHGARLIDVETGVRDEAAVRGLAYHAFAVVGIDGDGYKAMDPDHPQATQRLQTYDYDRRDAQNAVVNCMRAAVPVGMLIVRVDAPKVISIPAPAPIKPPAAPPPAPKPVDPTLALRAKLAQIAQIAASA